MRPITYRNDVDRYGELLTELRVREVELIRAQSAVDRKRLALKQFVLAAGVLQDP